MMIQYRGSGLSLGLISLFCVLYSSMLTSSERQLRRETAHLLVVLASRERPKTLLHESRCIRQAGRSARRLMQAIAADEGRETLPLERRARVDTKAYLCAMCVAVFQSRSGLSRHRQSKHSQGGRPPRKDEQSRIYRCAYRQAGCQYRSRNKSNVNRHVQRHKKVGKALLCMQQGCWKGFNTAQELGLHMQSSHSRN